MKKKKSAETLLIPIIIIVAAMALTSVLILSIGVNPIFAYSQMFIGAFGGLNNIINTINKAVPICFAGFAVALSTRAGIFNIGVEGQLVFGAFGSALAGAYITGLPAFIHIPVTILCGMLFGMLFAVIPTVLHITRSANLLVLCILMNSIAKLLITYFVVGPFAVEGQMFAATKKIEPTAQLPYLISQPNKLTSGILIAVFVAFVLWFYFNKTTSGYELKVCGNNGQAALYAGIQVKKYQVGALLAGGALAGLAGGIEVVSTYQRLFDGFSPGYGFDGIPIAMLASGNPFGIIFGSLMFGALRVGSTTMQSKAGVSVEIITFVQGVLITMIAGQYIIQFYLERMANRRRERR
jgi:ABC-type uncharacterized transport system, permease component